MSAARASVVALALVAAACDSDPSDRSAGVTTSAGPSPSTSTTVATAPPATSTTVGTTPPPPTTTIAIESDPIVTPLCSEPPDVIVRTVLDRAIVDRADPACVSSTLFDRLADITRSAYNIEVQNPATGFEHPTDGTSGWLVHVAFDRSNTGESVGRLVQQWSLTPLDDALIVTVITDVDTEQTVADGVAVVADFLDLLAGERFDDAAELLGRGGQDWDERLDLSALPNPPTDGADLTDALRQWCEAGALCTPPTSLTARPGIRGISAEATATWDVDGAVATATFTGWDYEGAPAVIGLPPLTGDAALAAVAAASNATVAIATMPDGRTVVLVDDALVELPVPPTAYPWSDGEFVYWRAEDVDESGEYAPRSIAVDLDGAVVCEVAGTIERVRERDDGGYVATVSREEEAVVAYPEYPIPTYAIDCLSGDETPIEPTSWRREGGYRHVDRIAGRTFSVDGDAEGNADILNEQGVSINGDDYAGFHTFSPDAELVVYGDYGVSFSPHVTTTIRARETIDGALRWSVELDRVFGALGVTRDRVVVFAPPKALSHEPWWESEYAVIYDAATGERLRQIPVVLDLLFLA